MAKKVFVYDPIEIIPPADELREQLDRVEKLAERLRIVLRIAEALRDGRGATRPDGVEADRA